MNFFAKTLIIGMAIFSMGATISTTQFNPETQVQAAQVNWKPTRNYKHISKNVVITNKSKSIYDVYGSVVGKNKPVYFRTKYKTSQFNMLKVDAQMAIGNAIYYHFKNSDGKFGWIWHGYTRNDYHNWKTTKHYKKLNKKVTINSKYRNRYSYYLKGGTAGTGQDVYFSAASSAAKLGTLNVDAQMTIGNAIYYHYTNDNAWIWHGYTNDVKPAATSKVLGVKYISQEAAGAPMGCEAASLLEALQYKGHAKSYSLKTFIKTMPIAKNGNPYQGFGGTPFKVTYGVYQSIFPSALTPWANKFGTAQNISGANLNAIINAVKKNQPVVAWITLNYTPAQWDKYSWGYGVDNAHVVTVDGYNSTSLHIVDPENGVYWISKTAFERSYNYMKFAVVIS